MHSALVWFKKVCDLSPIALRTRIVRESDYSPAAALSCKKKAKSNLRDIKQEKSKDIEQEQILTSIKGHNSVTN